MISSMLKKKVLVSFLYGLVITTLIWICRVLISVRLPLFLFNLMGILAIPGNVITTVIVGITFPEKGWQAIHGTSPYDYIAYTMNFLFYSCLIYLLQSLLFRFSKRRERYQVCGERKR